jgi:dTDP-4-dehydrorhamnose 3,5-epimerase
LHAIETSLSGVLLLEPKIWSDDRGFFFESYNQRVMEGLGIRGPFVQDNQSRSKKNVLRGLHYQIENAQGKLVRVVAGEVFDVAVDIRRSSTSFGKWFGVTLSAENHRMLWIPAGFAHGYLVLSDSVDFCYKTTHFYSPQHERTILFDDPQIGIEWPGDLGSFILSAKDRKGVLLKDAGVFA